MRDVAEAADAEVRAGGDLRLASGKVLREFLRVLDGTASPHLPPFLLMSIPGADAEKAADGGAWYPEAILPSGFEARHAEGALTTVADVTEVREYTAEEVRDTVLALFESDIEYWCRNGHRRGTPCSGVAFSLLCQLDGVGMELPPFDWLYETPAAVSEARAEAGLRPLPATGVIAEETHGNFYHAVPPEEPDSTSPSP